MAQQTHVNSATLLMGKTGTGKSSLARTIAEFLWEQHRKVLYFYSSDGGGIPAAVQEGVAIGIIKLWRMRTRDGGDQGLAFETCYRACQGWWPRRINPRTGETDPGVQMVAPIVKRIAQICPQGHVVKTVLLQQHLTPQPCPQCNVMVTTQNMRTQETLVESQGFEDRGGVFFDGLTSMLSWGKMEMGQRAGRLELKGEEGAIGGKIISGDLRFGATTRSHVGFMQDRGEELAHLSLGIPHLLVPPIFTALTMEVVDDAALSVIGPIISGRAKTDEAPQWFGNCLETDKIPAQTGAGEQFCLYLSEFTDPSGRRHLVKNRAAPGTMPDKLMDPVGGPAFSQFNLGIFFRKLNEALTAGIDAALQIYPDAPGIPDGIVEYGDGGQAAAQPVAASGPATLTAATAAPAAVAAGAPQAPQAPKTRTAKPRAAAAAPAPVAQPATPATDPPVSNGADVVAQAAPAPVQESPAAATAPVAPAAPAAPVQAAPQAQAPRAPAAPAAAPAPPPGRRPTPAAAGTATVAPSVVPRPPAAAPRAPHAAQPPAARPATAPPTTTT